MAALRSRCVKQELFATLPRLVRRSIVAVRTVWLAAHPLPPPLSLSLTCMLARTQDLLSDTVALEAVGASLGEEEMMRIFLSIARLSTGKGLAGEDPAAPAVASLRFWGVIRARKATYYIVEGAGASPEEPEDAAGDWDATLNTSKFWASTGLSSAWLFPKFPSPPRLRRCQRKKLGAFRDHRRMSPRTRRRASMIPIAMIPIAMVHQRQTTRVASCALHGKET